MMLLFARKRSFLFLSHCSWHFRPHKFLYISPVTLVFIFIFRYMKQHYSTYWLFILLLPVLCYTISVQAQTQTVSSPSGKIKVDVGLNSVGEPYYSATFNGKPVVGMSKLGMITAEQILNTGFKVTGSKKSTFDETWKPVWGEVAQIRNHYNELELNLQNKSGLLDITFRVFDDGFGFRYGFPKSGDQTQTLTVMEEMTEFRMTGDHTAWWQPGDWDSNEHVYSTTKISEIDAVSYLNETAISTQFIPDYKSVQTPIAMKTAEGVHLAIHEAALVGFPSMQLKVDNAARKFSAFLIPGSGEWRKAGIQTGFKTPWRTILISANAAGLLESKMILNLNEPNKLDDVSWIKPAKYIGIWWEMHIGKSTWDLSNQSDMQQITGSTRRPPHGATTENTRRYIDFAAQHGFTGVLVEGWNTGWEDWFGKWREDVFDFQTPYPDYDLRGLAAYSIQKGAPIIVHHETSSAVTSYEKYMDPAYKLISDLGLHAIKTGYVGRIIPKGEWHDGQWMVDHYVRVLEKAAASKIMVDAHEPVRPTGLHRTYPNLMACEAARGNEFNAWSSGNPPEHECILPFTRLLGGPMDYTPGIFNIKFSEYKATPNDRQVHTTLAKQLALYVTMYSPIQMAADLPEHYERNMAPFRFIEDVAVDWDDTKILKAAIGDYIITARKAKGTNNWFIGGITDENARTETISLDFLDSGKTYEATIYEDGPKAHWKDNPTEVGIRTVVVKKGSQLTMKLAAGGGFAISVMAK